MDVLAGIRAIAKENLREDVWHYLSEGEGTGHEQAFADFRLVPRPLRDLGAGHTRRTLVGQSLDHPIILAPVAYQRLFHRDGEAGSAIAASAQGGQAVISTLASQSFSEIFEAARQGGGHAPWFQLYWQGGRDKTLRLLERAQAAGFSTLVFTVDAPIKRASLRLPSEIAAVNLEPDAAHETTPTRAFDGFLAQAPTWTDLSWLRQRCQGALLIKGLMHPDDAQRAVEAGCDGVIVSSHGGRVLPGCATSLKALPAITRRLKARPGNKPLILLDSGIRSGRDIFIALALGASAVLLGRPYLWGLAMDGAMGVARVIRLLRDELEMTMALTGCASLDAIGPHCLAEGGSARLPS